MHICMYVCMYVCMYIKLSSHRYQFIQFDFRVSLSVKLNIDLHNAYGRYNRMLVFILETTN